MRHYSLDDALQQENLTTFYAEAAIPAYNRQGIQPVGVFVPVKQDKLAVGQNDVFVLLPHRSVESLVTASHGLFADQGFLKAGASHIETPREKPAFKRVESSLFLAFDGIPKIEIPTEVDTRVFQLRIYESHSEEFGRRKIDMFTEGGELAIFRRVGMTPVFFGEALVGSKLPNLTYMLGFDNRAAGEAAWQRFLKDPAWEKLKKEPKYAKTVSNITNIWLTPAACSQI